MGPSIEPCGTPTLIEVQREDPPGNSFIAVLKLLYSYSKDGDIL